MMRTKDPNAKREIDFVQGCALEPADTLLAWLAANGEPQLDKARLLRVPLVLKRGTIGFAMRDARLGPLDVGVGDAALGISLAMRAHGWPGDTCGFLAEGYWRDGRFDVVHTSSKPVDPATLASITHVEIQR